MVAGWTDTGSVLLQSVISFSRLARRSDGEHHLQALFRGVRQYETGRPRDWIERHIKQINIYLDLCVDVRNNNPMLKILRTPHEIAG
jgi:hypothetical protein